MLLSNWRLAGSGSIGSTARLFFWWGRGLPNSMEWPFHCFCSRFSHGVRIIFLRELALYAFVLCADRTNRNAMTLAFSLLMFTSQTMLLNTPFRQWACTQRAGRCASLASQATNLLELGKIARQTRALRTARAVFWMQPKLS